MIEKTASYEYQFDRELNETIHSKRLNEHEMARCTDFQTLSKLTRALHNETKLGLHLQKLKIKYHSMSQPTT